MGVAPCIKGVVIARTVEDVRALLARKDEVRERIEAQLSSGTLALLEDKVEISSWYPVEQYAELTELLWSEEGHGRVEYLRKRGEDAMQRLMGTGVYQQLTYVGRAAGRGRQNIPRRSILRGVRLVGSISGALRNFAQDSWEWHRDRPGVLLHHIREATHYPDTLRFASEGAETFLVRVSWPEAPAVTSERSTPDHIVFSSDYSGVVDPED